MYKSRIEYNHIDDETGIEINCEVTGRVNPYRENPIPDGGNVVDVKFTAFQANLGGKYVILEGLIKEGVERELERLYKGGGMLGERVNELFLGN